MSKMKMFATTFLVGGAVGCVGQLLMYAWAATGLGELLTVMAVLLTLGLSGAVLFATGLIEKAERMGSVAAFFPFYGLGAAMAKAHYDARENGASFVRGAAQTFKAFFVATGIGIAISLVVGFAMGALGVLGTMA